jgi:hypothetical protein
MICVVDVCDLFGFVFPFNICHFVFVAVFCFCFYLKMLFFMSFTKTGEYVTLGAREQSDIESVVSNLFFFTSLFSHLCFHISVFTLFFTSLLHLFHLFHICFASLSHLLFLSSLSSHLFSHLLLSHSLSHLVLFFSHCVSFVCRCRICDNKQTKCRESPCGADPWERSPLCCKEKKIFVDVVKICWFNEFDLNLFCLNNIVYSHSF